MRNVIYGSPAMQFFVDLGAEVLGYEKALGSYVGDCDLAYIVGLYDPPLYGQTLGNTQRAKRRLIHWCGSDVSMLSDASVLPGDAIHICDSDGLREELWRKGVEATTVMWPTRHHFEVTPLPEKPVVACYLGSNPLKYGTGVLQALGEAMPDVEIIGYMFGQYDSVQMAQLVADSSLYVRLTEHDGSAASAREFMEAGRRALVTHDLEYSVRVKRDDLPGLIRAVRTALSESEPDWDAAAYWSAQNSEERYLAQVEGVLNA